MKRREFIALFGGAVTWPLAVRAQGKTAHVLYLAELSPDSTPHLLKAFRDQLHVHGWDEGRNLTITYRWGLQSLDGLARDLETLKPDVVVAWTTPIVAAAQRVTKTLPIVMVGIADPIEAGFVVSLAHPGGNITGTTNLARDLGGKLLDLLEEVVPTVNSVTVLGICAIPHRVSNFERFQTPPSARTVKLWRMMFQPTQNWKARLSV